MPISHKKLFAGALAATTIAMAVRAILRRTRSFRGRIVIITGGSRGLGLELARCWGVEGAIPILCARTDQDLLKAVTELRNNGIDAHSFTCDVRSASEVRQFVEHVIKRWGRIDVLVNNAGIIQVGPNELMSRDDFSDAMATNFWGPFNLIESTLPYMRQRGSGCIVNIASIGGEISVPHLLPYCASKFALVGFSQGLAAEVAGSGISVTTVCPGLMRTGSPRNALFKGQHRKEYAWFSIGASAPGLTISSTNAARQIVSACRTGRSYLRLSLPSKVAIPVNALLPNISTAILQVANHFLPAASDDGEVSRLGKESYSSWSPSFLTRLNERAAAANNEIR